MDFCTFCGSPEVTAFAAGHARCVDHATTHAPRAFEGGSPGELLTRFENEDYFELAPAELEITEGFSGLEIGDQVYRLRDSAVLYKSLGMPAPYVLSLDAGLQRVLLEAEKERHAGRRLGVRTIGNEVRSIGLPESGQPVSIRRALEIAFEAMEELDALHDGAVDRVSVGARSSRFYLLTQTTGTMSRHAGDVIGAGVAIEVNGKVTASPYLKRLLCANGMMLRRARRGVVKRHADFSQQVREAVEYSQGPLLESFTQTDQVTVREPARAVASLLRDPQLGAETRRQLRSRVQRVGDRLTSTFDLVNLVTGVHRHRPESAPRLFEHGGQLAARFAHESRCEECGQWATHGLTRP